MLKNSCTSSHFYGMNLTDNNFQVAIDLLKNRYENKLSVINAHFLALLNINPIVKCTAESLREFAINLRKNLNVVKNLNYSSDELWDLLLIYLFEKKLDFGTRKAFEVERDMNELPELSEFLTFLDKRCAMLENLSSVESNKPKVTKKVSLHVNKGQNTPKKYYLFLLFSK